MIKMCASIDTHKHIWNDIYLGVTTGLHNFVTRRSQTIAADCTTTESITVKFSGPYKRVKDGTVFEKGQST